VTETQVYFQADHSAYCVDTKVYDLADLKSSMTLQGPAIILNQTSTILVEPDCEALIDDFGNVEITIKDTQGH
jgi:5-oxoprolinase (ATP-hydrolysing)